ncbi:MAG: malignant fibrous histiocytoma-amplified sequence 1, partial [Pseudomonadota bacterium]
FEKETPNFLIDLFLNAPKIKNLSFQYIEHLPTNLCQLESLKTLRIFESCISELPTNFTNLKNLEDFFIGSRVFKSLPHDITKMTSLKYIAIYSSEIEYLPENIFNMPTLKRITITDAYIKTLPESKLWENTNFDYENFGHIYLDFSNNLITELPQSFKYLKYARVDLQGNPLIVSSELQDIIDTMRTNECEVELDEEIEELLNER